MKTHLKRVWDPRGWPCPVEDAPCSAAPDAPIVAAATPWAPPAACSLRRTAIWVVAHMISGCRVAIYDGSRQLANCVDTVPRSARAQRSISFCVSWGGGQPSGPGRIHGSSAQTELHTQLSCTATRCLMMRTHPRARRTPRLQQGSLAAPSAVFSAAAAARENPAVASVVLQFVRPPAGLLCRQRLLTIGALILYVSHATINDVTHPVWQTSYVAQMLPVANNDS